MLHEFALDPAVLNNFHAIRYFLEKFGVHRGRLISRFPRKWKRMVFDACAARGDYEVKRIVECLVNAEMKFVSLGRDYDSNISWLNNAEYQHALKPFHAIISDSNPRGLEGVLVADELTETTLRWNVPRERVVPRRATDLASHVQPLLQISSELLFVDPYFDPYAPRFRKTLKQFLRVLNGSNTIQRIEYHLLGGLDCAIFQRGCSEEIPRILPNGVKVKFLRWRQKPGGEAFHARYIMTEKGGVRVDHGLDEGPVGENTDICLLDEPVYFQRWKDFQIMTAAYDLVDEITIVGS